MKTDTLFYYPTFLFSNPKAEYPKTLTYLAQDKIFLRSWRTGYSQIFLKKNLDNTYRYVQIIHMKTTLNLDNNLISKVMKIYNVPTKTKAIEIALKEAIATDQRKTLAKLFGKRKEIKAVPRRKI